MRVHFDSVHRFVGVSALIVSFRNRFKLSFIVRFMRFYFSVHRSVCVSFAFRLRFVSVLIVKNNGSGAVTIFFYFITSNQYK